MLRRMMLAAQSSAPPSGDPYWDSVKALLHFDGVNGSTVFTDETGRVWSAVGTGTISNAQYKFGGASYLNPTGNNGVRTANVVGDFTVNNDFTVECWVYRTTTSTGNRDVIATKYSTFNLDGFSFQISGGTGNGRANIGIGAGGTYNVLEGTTVIPLSTWTHIAVSMQSGMLRLFVNGILEGSLSIVGTPGSNTQPLTIGYDDKAPGREFNGYIDDFRWTHGVARYTENFSPPTVPFPNEGLVDQYYVNVIALLHLDGTDGSSVITDETGRTWTATGGANIDTAVYKFGGASCFFDGSSDAVTTGNLGIGATEDFTFDFWARANEIQSSTFFDARPVSGPSFLVTQPGADNTSLHFYAGGVNINSGTGTFTTDGFTLFSLERQGETARIYVNGVMVAEATGIGSINWNPSSFSMGKSINTSSNLHGWIDDVRITKGVARYKGVSFTPPVVAWPQG